MSDRDQAFLSGLAEILEVAPEAVGPDLELTADNWDSLAIVSTIGLIDECFGGTVPGARLRACTTVAALLELAQEAGGH
ncbi:MAG: acyl carrier protein [Cyanobacteriota bacterium]|jgi:acyl carrier protein|nr:acyl carrier protein [Cyanobacteriota bacterium]